MMGWRGFDHSRPWSCGCCCGGGFGSTLTAGVVPGFGLFLGGGTGAVKCTIGIGAWMVDRIWGHGHEFGPERPAMSRVELVTYAGLVK